MMRRVSAAPAAPFARRAAAVSLLFASACSTVPSSAPPPPSSAAAPARTPEVPAPPASMSAASAAVVAEAGAPPESQAISVAGAEALLFPPELGVRGDLADCRARAPEESIPCLLSLRYGGPAPVGDPEAGRAALDLYRVAGIVAGLLPEEQMDGGFRGKLLLLPELPVGGYRRHLGWVLAAHQDFERFFDELRAASPAPLRYRSRGLGYRFFRSHKRTTPSAYALGWNVAYNVVGSLNTSAGAVRETLFHEIFHLNDFDHGDWSAHALGTIYGSIVERCGTRSACLKPWSPGDTMVRGGTYYAFQPGNGESVHEYAAELATRYYLEQRAALRGEPLGKPSFKCGPPENRRAWEAIAKEFFGGLDRVPACPP